MRKFTEALQAEEILAKRKSRFNWLQPVDRNSKYFYSHRAQRWNSNKNLSIYNEDGNLLTDHDDISSSAVRFFQELLGSESHAL